MASADLVFAPLVGGEDDATVVVTRAVTTDALARAGWRTTVR